MNRRIGAGALALSLALVPWFAAAQDDAGLLEELAPNWPPANASLRYHLRQTVSSGTGQYDGWGDSLVSVGQYSVHRGRVESTYRWRYASPDRTDQGTVSREVEFDPSSRVYVGGTDLDDYDTTPGPLSTWLWISPMVANGEHLQILENRFDVVDREDVRVAGDMRHAILVRGTGTGHRADEYGTFATRFADDYWFDAATGMFLREERTEHDDGTYDGLRAGFEMSLVVEIVDASYAHAVGPQPDEPSPAHFHRRASEDDGDGDSSFFYMAVCIGAPFFLLFAALFFSARNPFRSAPFAARILAPQEPLPSDAARLSPHLGPFLTHMARVARDAGHRVAVAKSKTGLLEGLAIDDDDARIVGIYASDADCAELLRNTTGRLELISEVRYPPLPSVMKALQPTGKSPPSPYAYNLYETFEIMARRGAIEPLDYDTHVVTRMRPEDVTAAAELARRVYLVPCERFLSASLTEGDVAFVAKEDGKIVGIALATIVGTSARLHTLLVDPDAQARGLGKELYRARLRALADLGVDYVVTEVAANNHAAIEIARAFGMVKVGEMHVQSARPTREPLGVVRR